MSPRKEPLTVTTFTSLLLVTMRLAPAFAQGAFWKVVFWFKVGGQLPSWSRFLVWFPDHVYPTLGSPTSGLRVGRSLF